MNISGKYTTQHGDLFINQKGDEITASYRENGVCTGKLVENCVKGTWTNKEGKGLFEWTFDGKGHFDGKYKSGTEPGAMRGKWSGQLIVEQGTGGQSETTMGNSTQKEVVITIGGRIPKYFFGKLKEDLKEEAEALIENSGGELEDLQEFLTLFLAMGLENSDEAISEFESRITDSDMETTCPSLWSIFSHIKTEGASHFQLYEELFDWPSDWAGGNAYMSFFEDDASISVTIDGVKQLDAIPLKEFATTDFGYNEADEATSEEEKKLGAWIHSFVEKNRAEFGLGEDIGASVNKQGAKFMELWFTPPALDEFATEERAVVVYHDDIIDYTFQLEVDEFSYEKLAFLAHANYADFRNSACPTIANYVFYDNELIIPEEAWYRDKGITLEYESDGLTRLDFLLNG